MQIVFDTGAERHELDLAIGNPGATVADLVAALAPGDHSVTAIVVGDQVVPVDHDLVECGLHEGVVVSLARHPAPVTARPEWPGSDPVTVELHVVAGLEAGRRFPLSPGSHLIGRGLRAEVRLEAGTVSGEHTRVEVEADGTVAVRDLGSRNGTWVDGQPVLDEPVVVSEPSIIRLGAVELAVRAPKDDDRPTHIDPARFATGGGVIPFNRSPRVALPEGPRPERVPDPPEAEGRKIPIIGIASLTPVASAGGMVAVTGNVRYALIALLAPVFGVLAGIGRRRAGKKSRRRDARRFATELATLRERLLVQHAAARARLAALAPDVAEVARRAALPSTRVWERVRHEQGFDDFLVLRIGTGDVPWEPPLTMPKEVHPDAEEAIAAARTIPLAPIALELAGGGVVGIVGDRAPALALARSLVGQAAVHHGPAELPIAVCTTAEHGADWDWAKWLPHTRDASGATRMLSADAELSAGLLSSILRSRAPADGARATKPEEDGRPTMLLVLDDESITEGRRAPARTLLRGGGGPVAGIVLAATADRLPAMCNTVVTMTGEEGLADVHRPQLGERAEEVLVAGVDDATAREIARQLARFEDPELELVGAGLPDRSRLLPLLELDSPTAEAIAARWASHGPHPPPETPVGVAEDGVFTIDLVRDGPHGLVAGTTGSGKSELLRTLVVGLAASVDPDHLTFVLVDFKGGSAFDECSRLPHTVGMVTDLDPQMAERALVCLEAELKHRELVLRDAGVTDLPEYLQAGTLLGPMPRLLVVVDEFATLKADLPEFVDSLVGIAQRGRSLGVHMLLATQRPSGAVNENIKANTNLRIALRVQGDADSTDVIGVAAAAGIPRARAGRAFVRLGHDEIVPIQTALSTATDALGEVAAVDVAPFGFGPFARPPSAPPAGHQDARSDLGLLVAIVSEAFAASGRPPPRRPWPEPLPERLDLDGLLPATDTAAADAGSDAGSDPGGWLPAEVPLALVDDPEHQRQLPFGWRPKDGNLLLYGLVGSGTTTGASTLALSLATLRDADRCHLYVIDFGAGELAPLAGLPHCGGVIAAGERERQLRLVRALRAELDRRRQQSAAEREQQPAVVTILDGYAAFVAEYRDVVGQTILDDLLRVFADGPEVGLWMVVTGDRLGSVPVQVASLVRQKLLFRLADPGDYSIARIPAKAVPELPPGRAVIAELSLIAQVAVPAGSLDEAVGRIAAATPAPRAGPAAIAVLPELVEIAEVADASRTDARPWFLAVGRRERDLSVAGLTLYPSEHAMVVGGARAGKTATLVALTESLRAADATVTVVVVSGPRSDLAARVSPQQASRPDGLADALDAVEAATGRVALLIDDAEGVEDVGGRLEKMITAGPADLLVIAAGRPDVLRGMYNHWSRTLRRAKLGVLLTPNAELDGEVFGVNLPRRTPVAMVPGRGYVVNGGELELLQVARPTDLRT